MAKRDTSVKTFLHSMAGAPSLNRSAGTLINLWDALLLSTGGFGSVTLDSLSVSGNIVTATKSAGHGFSMLGPITGPVIKIAGATPSALNDEWRIESVPSSTTFTFVSEGINDCTATGTITAKIAPTGWAKPYSGTNKAVYARSDLLATEMLLRVDDSQQDTAACVMYESMTDVDTGTGPAPLTGNLYASKATDATTNQDWVLFADSKMFVWFCKGTTAWTGSFCFGDINSAIPGDAYNCVIIGGASSSTGYAEVASFSSAVSSWIARDYTQTGGAVQHMRRWQNPGVACSYPNPGTDGVLFASGPVFTGGAGDLFRGMFPAVFKNWHASQVPPNKTVVTAVINGQARDVFCISPYAQASGNYLSMSVDITGPWR